jgi:hypothetical protein
MTIRPYSCRSRSRRRRGVGLVRVGHGKIGFDPNGQCRQGDSSASCRRAGPWRHLAALHRVVDRARRHLESRPRIIIAFARFNVRRYRRPISFWRVHKLKTSATAMLI